MNPYLVTQPTRSNACEQYGRGYCSTCGTPPVRSATSFA